jgi:serine/threonine-protein kinase RsbW
MPCSLRLPSLPRNDPSVPAARHLVRAAMRTIGVDADCTHDIELALTEACTNVLQHREPAAGERGPPAPGRPALPAAGQRAW